MIIIITMYHVVRTIIEIPIVSMHKFDTLTKNHIICNYLARLNGKLEVNLIIIWYYDVMTWKRFSHYGLFWGNPPGTPHKRPAIQNFNVFCIASLSKLLNKQLSCPGDMELYDTHKTWSVMPPSVNAWSPVYKHVLTFIQAWISNYIHYKEWDKLLIHSQFSAVEPLKFMNG